MVEINPSNRRIAKNTLLLYIRTLFVMIVSLFTSRIMLDSLGVENYGIYIVVGGVVAMFSSISGALSLSISRFLTFELGKGDMDKLKRIFSTSVNIQFLLSVIIVILCETIGLWFLNHRMNIPAERISAANWVLQLSLIAFVINIVSIPYNAAIIAHEKMSVFAYFSILEVVLKLAIVYLLYVSPWDKLITYSLLFVFVSSIIRIVYGIYCHHHFEETHYQNIYDQRLIKDMIGFAGWNFFASTAYVFNTQGINIITNLFFGVGVNAARGITMQVEGAIMKFIGDFTTAINPQIIKSYASGDKLSLFSLICRGARYSYLLSLLISLPVFMEIDYILSIWLIEVPDHTSAFIRLSILAVIMDRLGNTGYVACQATGNIRRYTCIITGWACMVFPLTYIAFKLGAPAEASYVIFAVMYAFVAVRRLWLMRDLLGFPPRIFITDVLVRVFEVTVAAVILPLTIVYAFDTSFFRLVVSVIVCILSVGVFSLLFGVTSDERLKLLSTVKSRL